MLKCSPHLPAHRPCCGPASDLHRLGVHTGSPRRTTTPCASGPSGCNVEGLLLLQGPGLGEWVVRPVGTVPLRGETAWAGCSHQAAEGAVNKVRRPLFDTLVVPKRAGGGGRFAGAWVGLGSGLTGSLQPTGRIAFPAEPDWVWCTWAPGRKVCRADDSLRTRG